MSSGRCITSYAGDSILSVNTFTGSEKWRFWQNRNLTVIDFGLFSAIFEWAPFGVCYRALWWLPALMQVFFGVFRGFLIMVGHSGKILQTRDDNLYHSTHKYPYKIETYIWSGFSLPCQTVNPMWEFTLTQIANENCSTKKISEEHLPGTSDTILKLLGFCQVTFFWHISKGRGHKRWLCVFKCQAVLCQCSTEKDGYYFSILQRRPCVGIIRLYSSILSLFSFLLFLLLLLDIT